MAQIVRTAEPSVERSRWVIRTTEGSGVGYVVPIYVIYSTRREKARARRTAEALRARPPDETLRPVRLLYIPRKRRGCPCLDCRLRDFFRRQPARTRPPEMVYNWCIPLEMAEKLGEGSVEDGDPRHFVYQLKQRARIAVSQAIKSGRLIRPSTCDLCGRDKDDPALLRARGNRAQAIEADHLDYREPFHIQWLCIECHATASAAWFIAWDFKLRRRYRYHPAPEPWWCWLCQMHHSVCPVMCPVPLGLPLNLSRRVLRQLLGLPGGSLVQEQKGYFSATTLLPTNPSRTRAYQQRHRLIRGHPGDHPPATSAQLPKLVELQAHVLLLGTHSYVERNPSLT